MHATSGEAAKAAVLQQKLTAAGLKAPSTDTLAALYGTDGGALCAAAKAGEGGLARGNVLAGSAFRGHARTQVEASVVDYSREVIHVYCPAEMAIFDAYVDRFDVGSES